MKRFALLSDIHGNIWALQAVLADITRRDIDQIINLGDSLYGPLEPQMTAECLMQHAILNIQGNQDRLLLQKSQTAILSSTMQYCCNSLSSQSWEWLAAQPANAVITESLYLCHGTPDSDETYLLEQVSLAGPHLQDERIIQQHIQFIQQQVVLCGHSHIPRVVWTADGRLIINPGSVGLPAYEDDLPALHKMQTGSPHARYALLLETDVGWQVELVAIPYSWTKAVYKAQQNGRDDWAQWLASGRVAVA